MDCRHFSNWKNLLGSDAQWTFCKKRSVECLSRSCVRRSWKRERPHPHWTRRKLGCANPVVTTVLYTLHAPSNTSCNKHQNGTWLHLFALRRASRRVDGAKRTLKCRLTRACMVILSCQFVMFLALGLFCSNCCRMASTRRGEFEETKSWTGRLKILKRKLEPWRYVSWMLKGVLPCRERKEAAGGQWRLAEIYCVN